MAEALGVARQRVYEIVEPEDFPAPIVRLKAGPVWQRSVLARFMGTGRPRGALAGAGGGEVLGYQPPKVVLPVVDLFVLDLGTVEGAFTESTINQVVSKRMVKRQQMRWTPRRGPPAAPGPRQSSERRAR